MKYSKKSTRRRKEPQIALSMTPSDFIGWPAKQTPNDTVLNESQRLVGLDFGRPLCRAARFCMRDDLLGQVSNLRIHQSTNPLSSFSVSVCISSVRGRGPPEPRPESCPKGPPTPQRPKRYLPPFWSLISISQLIACLSPASGSTAR